MWIEKTKNGYRAVERYKDPVTNKVRKASVSMEKNTASTRKVAERLLNQRIAQLTSSVYEDITMGELTSLWLEDSKRRLKPSTVDSYESRAQALKKIIPFDYIVSGISVRQVKYNLERIEKISMRNNSIKSIKTILRWGYKNDFIDDISWIDKLQTEEDKLKKEKLDDKYLESYELTTLVNSIQIQKYRDLTLFLALTGMRVGEALALEFTDINLDTRTISVSNTFNAKIHKVMTAKTSSSVREIYIQDELLSLTKRLYQTASSNRFVSTKFFPECGYCAYYCYIAKYSEVYAGKRITPHALRHTHVALLAEQGVSLEVISRRLGHENSEITKKIYFHVTEKLKQKDFSEVKEIHIL